MDFQSLLLGALMAAIATSIGAFAIILFKIKCKEGYSKLLAFAAGVMGFSAVEMFAQSHALSGDITAVTGLAIGIVVLFLAEKSIPHMHRLVKKVEIEKSKKKAALIAGAITIHNVPEGFAIAAAFAGSNPLGWLVATSIAIQDVPEGFMVAAPLVCYGMKQKRAIQFGIFSGVVEFFGAMVGFAFLSLVSALGPIALAFSSGAMAYVVLVEIMPDAIRGGKEREASISFILGAIVAFALATLLGVTQ
ncbi:MAG: ZIP family metal transporter [Candidatus Micrarchaeia archaeon]